MEDMQRDDALRFGSLLTERSDSTTLSHAPSDSVVQTNDPNFLLSSPRKVRTAMRITKLSMSADEGPQMSRPDIC